MAKKRKKKGHGGLKFLSVVVAIVAVIVTVSMTKDSEFVQRVLGNREDRRLERTALTPRFGFASARLHITLAEIYNSAEGGTVDLTTTRDVSIDRESLTAKSDVKIDRTATEVAPGVNAIPYDALNASFTEILTKNNRYESPADPGQPWTWYPIGPYYYGTEIDAHYIPMIDDIMGFELRDLPSKPMTIEPASGFKSTVRRRVTGPTPPSAVTTSYTYEIDLDTYRRAVPILAGRTAFRGPGSTPVTLTIGFDDVGLLRFADVDMGSAVATTVAQQLGTKHSASYHYTLTVDDISGDAISIDVPTDVVDAPDDTP